MAEPPRNGWSDDHDELARESGFDSWAGWIREIEEEKGHRICGARTKSYDRPCRERYAPDACRGRCGRHGGASKRGAEHPQFEHGFYSEVVAGTEFAEDYRRVRERDRRLSLDETIDFVEAILRNRALKFVEGEIDFEEFRAVLRQFRHLVDSERRILEAKHEAMDREEARARFEAMMSAMERAIQGNVSDPDDRQEALEGFSREMDRLRSRRENGGRGIPAEASSVS